MGGDTADATVRLSRLSRQSLVALMLARVPVDTLTEFGSISIDGDATALKNLVPLLDNFEFWFNIVTP